jgi:hypothetical protein
MTKYRRDFSLSFTAPSLRARTSALGRHQVQRIAGRP